MREALQEALKQLQEQRPARGHAGSVAPTLPAAAAVAGVASPPQEPQQQALRELAALYHVLLRGQLQMQAAMQQYAAVNLRRIAADLLALSEREEEIAGSVPAELRGVALGDLARRQNRVLRAARGVRDRMQEVGSRSPALSMRLMRDLDAVVEGLERRRAGAGAADRRRGPARIAGQHREAQPDRDRTAHRRAADRAGRGRRRRPCRRRASSCSRWRRNRRGSTRFAQELQRQLQQQGPSQEARAAHAATAVGAGRARRPAGGAGALASGPRPRASGCSAIWSSWRATWSGWPTIWAPGASTTRRSRDRSGSWAGCSTRTIRSASATSRSGARAAPRGRRSPGSRARGARRPADDPAAPFLRQQESVAKAPADYRDLVRRYYRALENLLSPPAATPERPAPAVSAGSRAP